jgi:branched-chain amino acid transport system substrate-binding protein
MYFPKHYNQDDPSPLVQNLVKNYKETYKETPNSFAALGYDAAAILFNAIGEVMKDGGKIEPTPECRQAIIDKMTATDLECVTGRITFVNGNPVKDVSLIKIEHEKYNFEGKYR